MLQEGTLRKVAKKEDWEERIRGRTEVPKRSIVGVVGRELRKSGVGG